ncbi:MAG: hypothetical protein JNK70_13165 [Phycisphaerae bacterium]|nr:hypothetical protein [Phycisphaerae bacterium]
MALRAGARWSVVGRGNDVSNRRRSVMDDGQARSIVAHEGGIRSARMWIGIAYGIAIGVSAATVVIGLRSPPPMDAIESNTQLVTVLSTIGQRQALVTFGLVGVVASVVTLPIALMLLSMWREAGRNRIAGLESALKRFTDHAALSDDARRVIFRKQEREMLRRAIEEDLASEDWDAASVLVSELAERFGYRADAEEFRSRIDAARRQTVERRVAEAISLLDGLIIQHRWDDAAAEAARIGRLYPESPRVSGLSQRVQGARDAYVQEIERKFLVAAQEDRVDEAMRLLQEIDQYLTEAQAAPFREVARGVIGKARENLGAQFKLAVQDRRWRDAASVGERIIQQFPNTRMAEEVRGLIDGIRTRAIQVA